MERLAFYCFELPKEAPQSLPTDIDLKAWPAVASIKIENLEVRYPSRPDYAVIADLSLSVEGGERIGICGRTGSGKVN